jgi:hypothetical protein
LVLAGVVACGRGDGVDVVATESPPPADAQAIRGVEFGRVDAVQAVLRQLESARLETDDVSFADITGDRREEAIVPIASQGTLGNLAYVVLTLRAGVPAAILTRTPDRSSGGGLRLEVEDGRLVETVAEYGAEDPFCCPSVLRKTYFRWDGARLQVERVEREQRPKGPKS